jgi:hypothetical protein
VDIVAEPGIGAVAPVDGRVSRIGQSYEDDDQYKYVEIATPNGYTVRTHYVSPGVKVGDAVVGGESNLGTVQDIAQEDLGITNHVHVELADPQFPVIVNPKRAYDAYRKIDPTSHFQLSEIFNGPGR